MCCYHYHLKHTFDYFPGGSSIVDESSERYECYECGHVLTDLQVAERKLFYSFKKNDNLHWQEYWK